MSELYLRMLDRLLTQVLMALAFFLFMRGHNEPGGGFIAGLTASAAIQLQILSRGDNFVRRRIGPYLLPAAGIGLFFSVTAALIGYANGGFFKSVWFFYQLGELEIELGTPVLFDLGVFIVVFAVVVSFLLSLSRSTREELS